MFRTLLSRIGFPWAVRTIAFVVLTLYFLSYAVLINHPKKPPTARRFFDTSTLTDSPFLTLCFASILSASAYYIPFLYLPLLTKVSIPNINPNLGIDLLSIMNGTSAIGRLVAGIAAAKYGPTETVTVCAYIGSVLLFSWMAVDTVPGVIAWSVFWGMISGVLVTMPGAYLPLFVPSPTVLGTRSGMYWSFVGVGLLIGSPIGGAMYDVKKGRGDSWRLQVFAGVSMVVAATAFLYPITHLKKRAKAVSGEQVEIKGCNKEIQAA